MEISEIFSDAFKYPLENVRAIGIYLLFSVVMMVGIVIVGFGIGLGSEINSPVLAAIFCILGLVLSILMLLLVEGYILDVMKTGINRVNIAPEIDFSRQISNGAKLIIVAMIYIGIPLIIMALLANINGYLVIVGLILLIIALFVVIMAECRLAKTDSLGEALDIGGAINDISKIGTGKVIGTILIIILLTIAISVFTGVIEQISETLGAILSIILTLYISFVQCRAYGLLYSNLDE